MEFEQKQIPPPSSWEHFESLCLALFQEMWSDPTAQKNGRRGQRQKGVDIFGVRGGTGEQLGAQCKVKTLANDSELTFDEALEEVRQAEAFRPKLTELSIATTARRDATLQERVRLLSEEREARGEFRVKVLAWVDLVSLIGKHRAVLEQFYPEHRADAQGLFKRLDELARQPTAQPASALPNPWFPIHFEAGRDLGPALLGRDLGPGDALVCPRLVEADALANELRRSFSVRLIGVSGAGKSVCAFQAAHTLYRDGWSVVQLQDAALDHVSLNSDPTKPTVFLVDSGHRMVAHALRRLEHQASPTKYLISTHSAEANASAHRGAVMLDTRRAVQSIAAGLRADMHATLAAVKRVDDRIGDGYLDEELGRRIDAAEQSAQYPWQFCFVLGGGWRRTAMVVDACRAHSASLVLTAIAALQLVSRDAAATLEDVEHLLAVSEVTDQDIEAKVRWFVSERIVISHSDLRCPHQRFSSALLRRAFDGLDRAAQAHVQRILREAVSSSRSTLAGCRDLLQEACFSDWVGLHPDRWLDELARAGLLRRCFGTTRAEDRMFACLLLAELGGVRGVPWRTFIDVAEVQLLGTWISTAKHPLGHGLHWLLNAIWSDDKKLACEIVASSDPVAVARIASGINVDTAYSVAQMVDRMALTRDEESWQRAFRGALDRPAILKVVAKWPLGRNNLFFLSKYCSAIGVHDRELGFSILEVATPQVQKAFAEDAVDTFQTIDDILSYFLGTWDILGVRGRPGTRELAATRRLLRLLQPDRVAEQLSASSVRDFEPCARLLGFLHEVASRLAREVREKVDLERVSSTIGDRWAEPTHEVEVFMGLMSQGEGATERVVALLEAKARDIKVLPARFVVIAPQAAITVLQHGNTIALGECMALEWTAVAYVVDQVHTRRPDLVVPMLAPHAAKAVEGLQSGQVNTYEGIAEFVSVMKTAAPGFLEDLLRRVDPGTAERRWAQCLKEGGRAGQGAAYLMEASLSLTTGLEGVAARLRKRFPSASRPKGRLSTLLPIRPSSKP